MNFSSFKSSVGNVASSLTSLFSAKNKVPQETMVGIDPRMGYIDSKGEKREGNFAKYTKENDLFI